MVGGGLLQTGLLKAVGRVAKSNGGCGQRDLTSTYVLHPS